MLYALSPIPEAARHDKPADLGGMTAIPENVSAHQQSFVFRRRLGIKYTRYDAHPHRRAQGEQPRARVRARGRGVPGAARVDPPARVRIHRPDPHPPEGRPHRGAGGSGGGPGDEAPADVRPLSDRIHRTARDGLRHHLCAGGARTARRRRAGRRAGRGRGRRPHWLSGRGDRSDRRHPGAGSSRPASAAAVPRGL